MISSDAQSATQTLVGVDSLRFSWAPASGNPDDYLVGVSRNGDDITAYQWVTQASVDIPVKPYDRVAIAVIARRINSNKSPSYSQASPLSDEILVLPSPVFPVEGQWTLHCTTCAELTVRSLANAAQVEQRLPVYGAPWEVLGRVQVAAGDSALLWHNPQLRQVQLWNPRDPRPVRGTVEILPGVRFAGSADLDGDGSEELFFYHERFNLVDVMTSIGGSLERQAIVSGAVEWSLVAVGEYTGDDRIDLIWHHASSGSVRLWSVPGNVRTAQALPSPLPSGSYRMFGYYPDAQIARVADFDGDGRSDLLWRRPDGSLQVTFLATTGQRTVALKPHPDDPYCDVVGVVDVVDVFGVPGMEIALQDRRSGQIVIALPGAWFASIRPVVVSPGSSWKVVDVGSRAGS